MIEVDIEEFEKWVDQGIESIEEKYLSRVKNVAVVVEDEPTQHQRDSSEVEDGLSLYGLYEGIPPTERGDSYTFSLPDKITIFRRAILEAANNHEEAKLIIRNTLWHEFGHYFGLSEDEIQIREVKEGRDRF